MLRMTVLRTKLCLNDLLNFGNAYGAVGITVATDISGQTNKQELQ